MNFFYLVDCQWADWEMWTTCGDSCSARDGEGSQTRTRVIAIEVLHGGVNCTEPDRNDDQSCSVECPGKKTNL